MDRIAIRGIRAMGRHGADPGERDAPQPFDIEAEIGIDLRDAAVSDDLADTIDYAALHAQIVEIVETTSYALIERLASDLLDALFADPRASDVCVTIAKPGILLGATPSVTLRRSRAT